MSRRLSRTSWRAFGVVRCLGDLARCRVEQIDQLPVLQPIQAVLSLLAIFHQTRVLQLSKVSRNAALAGGEYFLEFGYGKFFALEQQQKPHPVGVCQYSQRF